MAAVDLGDERLLARKIQRVADSYVPRFARTFEASVVEQRSQITDEAIEQDIARGLTNEPEALYAAVDAIVVAKAEGDDQTQAVYSQVLVDGAKVQGVVLDLQSPFVHEAAKTLTATLVREVKAETKRAIRQVIFESILEGKAPAVSRKTIRQIVGLTRRDALAVMRYPNPRGAERYANKLLNRRAMNIARTETMRASNRGQIEAWRQMASGNLIDTSRFKEEWRTVGDDRMCPRCAPMNGKQVSLGSQFTETERGVLPSERISVVGESVQAPPLHPQCRCVLVGNFTS